MEIRRPRLDDPAEFKIIKDIYFKNDLFYNEQIDPIEKLERLESKQRNNLKNNR